MTNYILTSLLLLLSNVIHSQNLSISSDYQYNFTGNNITINTGIDLSEGKHTLEVGLKILLKRQIQFNDNVFYKKQFFPEKNKQRFGFNFSYSRNFKVKSRPNYYPISLFYNTQITKAPTKSEFLYTTDSVGLFISENFLSEPHLVIENNLGISFNVELAKRIWARFGFAGGVALIRNRDESNLDVVLNGGQIINWEFSNTIMIQFKYILNLNKGKNR